MNKPTTIPSNRLLLRPWRDDDLEPLIAMSNDERVMEFFPSFHTREDCEAMLGRIRTHHELHGFGYWAVEIPGARRSLDFWALRCLGLRLISRHASKSAGGSWPSTGVRATQPKVQTRH